MGRRIRVWGFAFAAAVMVPTVRGSDTRPLWPLDAPVVLTSSFGEPRATHLHAGIDLGTGGRTGVKCFAVEDGWVARMRMSPFGYGKAIYIQLDSGPLVVYAHLDRFAKDIAARAWEEQRKRGRYTFDIYLRKNEIRVRRGQVVAWSGETGVGFPHLHFEMRDGDVARNPQTGGFRIRDRVAPTIRDISVLPLEPEAHVDGELDAHVIRVGESKRLSEPVIAAGRIGFAVRALDRAAPGPYRQAPYAYEVLVNGRRLFRAVHERFDYAHNHQIVLDYDQERLVGRRTRSFQLFARPGNRLSGREPPGGGRGVLSAGVREAIGSRDLFGVPPGRHNVEIRVADVAGHTRSVRFPLIVSHRPRIEVLTAETRGESLHVVCDARDEDRHALALRLERSTDSGTTWREWPARRDSSTGVWWAASAWDGSTTVAVRARVTDPVGLDAVRTCVAGAPPAVAGDVPLEVSHRWRYGRLELEIESRQLLDDGPGVWLERPDGRRRRLDGVRQVATRRWTWAAAIADLDDVDALIVEATSIGGLRSIRRQELRARIVRRGVARVVDDLHAAVRLEFDRDTLFEDVAVQVSDFDARKLDLGPELEPVGPCVRVEPLTAALDRRVRVAMDVPASRGDGHGTNGSEATPSRVALFEDARRGLNFLTAVTDSAGRLVGEARFTGVFVLLRDQTPPEVRGFRAQPRRSGQPHLRFLVEDLGAGIADGDIVVEVDGVRAIPEWDPETRRVRVHPATKLERGSHQLLARVTDQVGNRTTRTWQFHVP